MSTVTAPLAAIAVVTLTASVSIGLGAGGAPLPAIALIALLCALVLGGGLALGSRPLVGAALILGTTATAAGIMSGAAAFAILAGATLLTAGEASTEALLRRGVTRIDTALARRLLSRWALVTGFGAATAAALVLLGRTPGSRSVPLDTAAVALAVGVPAAAAVVAHRRLGATGPRTAGTAPRGDLES